MTDSLIDAVIADRAPTRQPRPLDMACHDDRGDDAIEIASPTAWRIAFLVMLAGVMLAGFMAGLMVDGCLVGACG